MSLDISPPLKLPTLHPALERMQRLAPLAMLAMLFVAALVQRHLVFGSSDVTWLITADEKMLGGHPLYSEVLETNPPIAPLAYLPAVLIGRALGIAAERVTDGLVFLAAAVSLGAAVAMLRGSAAARMVDGWSMVLLAFAVLTILPAQTFGQREHIALIAILPGLAAASLRAHGERPPLWALAVAGLGSCIAPSPTCCSSPSRAGPAMRLAVGAQFLAALLYFNNVLEIRQLEAPVARLIPHPKMLVLSGDPGFGHPLVRMIGGTWVSRQQAFWVHLYAAYLKREGGLSADELARIDAQAARERTNLIADFKRQPPDVIIVDLLDEDFDGWRSG